MEVSVAEVVLALERLSFRRAASTAPEVTAEVSRVRPPPAEEAVLTALLQGITQGVVAQVGQERFRLGTARAKAHCQEAEKRRVVADDVAPARVLPNPRPHSGANRLAYVRPRQADPNPGPDPGPDPGPRPGQPGGPYI